MELSSISDVCKHSGWRMRICFLYLLQRAWFETVPVRSHNVVVRWFRVEELASILPLPFQRDKNITLRLKDKKDVVLLSTIHSTEMVVIKDDLKPKMVVDYNNSMGGIDK
ncbi:hypothetical protein ANN_09637, partial [Periplaneta americana]